MAYNKYYVRINWKNRPSTSTPLGATNLNHVDQAVDELDNRIVNLDAAKFNASDAQNLCNGIDYDTGTGVFVFRYMNGATKRVDLNIEKIPVSMSLSADGVLTITNTDGSKYTSNIASLLVTINFVDSSEIDFQISDSGKTRTVTAVIKNGSITAAKLDPAIQADILNDRLLAETAAANAQTHARDSKRYSAGGVIPADAEDNAKYYCGEARDASASADTSAKAAKTSETNAAASAKAAKTSETNAAVSAKTASDSNTAAGLSAANAKASEGIALNCADSATASKAAAGKSATDAESSNQSSKINAQNAKTSETNAQKHASDAEGWALQAEQVVDIHIAAPDRAGIVMPDDVTFKVAVDGTASVPTASSSVKGLMKGSAGVKIAADGSADVDTAFTQATALANIIAGEAIGAVLGKVSKAIATTMNLEQGALLKSMLTSQNVNDVGKVPTASLLYNIRQELLNQLSGKLDAAKLVNNLLSTDPTTVLAGPMGKLLQDQITQLNGEVKQNSFNLENKPAEQTDLNAIYSGVHRYSNLSKNIPSAHNGYIIAIKRTVSTFGQIALDDSGTLYSRVCVDSSWENWK